MRILIADDHEMVRDAISAFLRQEGGYDICAVGDFDAALEKLEQDGPFELVLLDYTMPGMTGLDRLHEARAANREQPVAIMSGTAARAVAKDALAAGAAGFLPKTMGAKSLLNAVRFMAMGEQYAPLDFMTREEPEEQHPLAAKLSDREREVLSGLCRGLSNKEIARDLDLQEVTIKLHVQTLCRKLEAKNRTQAAMIAKDAGLF